MLDVTALEEHLEYDLNFAEMDEQKCYELLRYASAAAALVTASYGAICVMPEEKDIFKHERTEKMQKNRNKKRGRRIC